MNTENPPKININSSSLKLACSNCSVRELCMPVGLNPDLFEMLDKQIYIRRHIKAGTAYTIQVINLILSMQSKGAFSKLKR